VGLADRELDAGSRGAGGRESALGAVSFVQALVFIRSFRLKSPNLARSLGSVSGRWTVQRMTYPTRWPANPLIILDTYAPRLRLYRVLSLKKEAPPDRPRRPNAPSGQTRHRPHRRPNAPSFSR